MEIPDAVLGLILIYLEIVTLLVIGAISRYIFKKERKSIYEIVKTIDTIIIGIFLGIFTGATIAIYYNWINCTFITECKFLEQPDYFNISYPVMFGAVIITIMLLAALKTIKIILIHRRN